MLRHRNFSPDCLKRRAVPGEANANNIELWTNHRVMEWLKEINLSEYAPNLRGSGVHGALVLLEPKFTADFLATLLSIPSNKTLLRRHLNLHFKDLVGKDTVAGNKWLYTLVFYQIADWNLKRIGPFSFCLHVFLGTFWRLQFSKKNNAKIWWTSTLESKKWFNLDLVQSKR